MEAEVASFEGLFSELISTTKPPKLITIVAENFTLLGDPFLTTHLAQAGALSIPGRLVQIGPLQSEIGNFLEEKKWNLNHYADLRKGIFDEMSQDLKVLQDKSLIYINDVSRLELIDSHPKKMTELLKLFVSLKRRGHFVVILYQNSSPASSSTFLRDLEFLSDAFAEVKCCKKCYLISTWFQITKHRTLIPPRVETYYFTCRIEKSAVVPNRFEFCDQKRVEENFNPDDENFYLNDLNLSMAADNVDGEETDMDPSADKLDQVLDRDDIESTLPYTKAQNPEQSRIFYYPDKDDDIDEDDPDNDLNI